jgi:hypothetical protein
MLKRYDFFLIFTSFAWEGQNGLFQIDLTANLTDFDGNDSEGSVNYSDGSDGSLKISLAVGEEVKISNGTEGIDSKNNLPKKDFGSSFI